MKDIHNMERQFIRAKELCREELDQQCRAFMRYVDWCIADGRKKARLVKILGFLRRTARLTNKPLASLGEYGLIKLLARINTLNISGPSRNDHIIILRGYLKFSWRHKKARFERVRELLKKKPCNYVRRPIRKIFPWDIGKLVNAATTRQMKILIPIIWESGGRIQEVLELRQDRILFFPGGAILHFSGKTGERDVLITLYAKLLKSWCAARQGKAYVFSYSYGTWNKHKQKIQKKLGLPELYAHLFRKSSSTWCSKFMTEALVKKRYGWTPDSPMLRHYEFNESEDANAAYMQASRIMQKQAKKPRFSPKFGMGELPWTPIHAQKNMRFGYPSWHNSSPDIMDNLLSAKAQRSGPRITIDTEAGRIPSPASRGT